jgi:hypothetical protein
MAFAWAPCVQVIDRRVFDRVLGLVAEKISGDLAKRLGADALAVVVQRV